MDIWITLSEKAFKEINCKELETYDIACLRINLCRESDEWILATLNSLKQANFNLGNIYLDIANNKPRIIFENPAKVISINKNDKIFLSKTKSEFTVNDLSFFQNIAVGNTVIFGDGLIEFAADEINQEGMILKALSTGTIKNLMSLFVSQNDFSNFHIDSIELSRVNNLLKQFQVGLILSFVQSEIDVINAKTMFSNASSLIPKIETSLAYRNIDNIFKVAEKVVIGRGDLGLSMGIEKIGVVQNEILRKAKAVSKSVIIATETLESFTFRPYPFRSEVVDITNSFTSGAEAILLTSETASIDNPYLPISFLRKTINYLNTTQQ